MTKQDTEEPAYRWTPERLEEIRHIVDEDELARLIPELLDDHEGNHLVDMCVTLRNMEPRDEVERMSAMQLIACHKIGMYLMSQIADSKVQLSHFDIFLKRYCQLMDTYVKLQKSINQHRREKTLVRNIPDASSQDSGLVGRSEGIVKHQKNDAQTQH